MSRRIVASTIKKAATTGEPTQDSVRITLPGKDFIFAQVSINSSVMVEDESYLIKPDVAKFVNANGDGWTNDSLKANYQSYIGAFNYINHVQEPELSVGFLADAALRRLIVDPEQNTYIYYVDLLVATSKAAHPDLARKILANKVQYLSMGCESFVSTCSACGHQAEDETGFCDHLSYNKGKYFLDKFGKKRITCELLGDERPGSCTFIEASWLTERPAFDGAVKRNLLAIGPDQSVDIVMPRENAMKPAVQRFVDI